MILWYNTDMKRLLLTIVLIIFTGCTLPVFSNEIEEDYFDIASSYCVTGDYNTAIEYLDKILILNPNNTRIRDLKRGLQHVISQDKKSFVSSVNPYVKQAQENKRIGDEDKEVSSLLEGVRSSNSYLAYYYLGNFYRDKRDYMTALDYYNAAVSARADFAPAYLASGVLLNDTCRYQASISSIDKYLTFSPNDDFAYALKSRAEFSLGMLDDAKRDNDKAIEINDCPEYQFDKAKILYKYENYSDSKKLFESLLPDIQTSKIYEYMGLCDYALKDYTNALTNIDRAIILSDDDEYLENKYNEIKEILEQN